MSTTGVGAQRDYPTAAYLVGFLLIGIALSTAGPVLSHLRETVGTDDSGIASVFAGGSAGYIVGSMVAGRLLDRGHGHRAWVSAMWAAVGGMLAISVAPTLAALVAVFAILGCACGIGDVCGNTLTIWARPDSSGAALNALHMMFALGATLTPVIVNRSLAWFGSVSGVAIPMAATATYCSWTLLRSAPPQKGRVRAVTRGAGARWPLVAVVCAFFFANVALETGYVGWIHSYAEQIGYGDATTATALVTLFWLGFTLGRMVSIPLARRASPGTIVAASMTMTMAVSLLFWVAGSAGPMLWASTFLLAVSIAPQYASMMAFAEEHLSLSGGNTAAIVACSGVGGLVLPWLLGQLFDAAGPRVLPPTTLVAAVVATVVAAVTGRLLRTAAHQRTVGETNRGGLPPSPLCAPRVSNPEPAD